MGKKRITVIGSSQEQEIKSRRAIQLEQKKIREGKKSVKAPGLAGGQRVVDTTAESLAEYEIIEAKRQAAEALVSTKAAPAPKKARTRSATYAKAKSLVDPLKSYPLSDALKLLRTVSLTKFDGTVELHLTTKTKNQSHTVELPFSPGKTRKIGIVDEKFISNLDSGNIDLNFDLLLVSPDLMPKLVKFAKILGPKGLMPNPKTGTIVADPAAAAKKLAGGNSLQLKSEKDAPVIHTFVGKLSQKDPELEANISTVLSVLPVTKAVLKSTMSPVIKLQMNA